MEGYRGQYAGGKNHYLTTVLSVVDALRTHIADDEKKLKDEHKIKRNTWENSFAESVNERRCCACGAKQHMLDTCPHRKTVNTISITIQEILIMIPIQKLMMRSTLQGPVGAEQNCMGNCV